MHLNELYFNNSKIHYSSQEKVNKAYHKVSLFVRGISASWYSCGHNDIFKMVTDQVRMQAYNTQKKVPVGVKKINIYKINS